MVQSFNRAFTGSVINPITDARLAAGYSINALAKKLGLSRQYVTKVEQGIYTSINPSVIKWAAENSVIPSGEVIRRYHIFQNSTRINTKSDIDPVTLGRHENDTRPGHVIFGKWREGYWPSVIAFCNAMCVHPETVKTYEEGIRPEMPAPLKKALLQVELLDVNWNDRPPAPQDSTSQTAV